MRIRTAIDIGAAIRQRRRELGLDQDDLAKRIAVSRKWVVEAEKGKPSTEVGLLLRAFKELGLRLSLQESTADIGQLPVNINRIVDRAAQKRK